jgi:hypothetical protein
MSFEVSTHDLSFAKSAETSIRRTSIRLNALYFALNDTLPFHKPPDFMPPTPLESGYLLCKIDLQYFLAADLELKRASGYLIY